jgi:nucleotide-binding universal stress UspA family protein
MSIENKQVMLIVMGRQGRGPIPEIFLGSVSHNMVRHAPIPVLLVPALR